MPAVAASATGTSGACQTLTKIGSRALCGAGGAAVVSGLSAAMAMAGFPVAAPSGFQKAPIRSKDVGPAISVEFLHPGLMVAALAQHSPCWDFAGGGFRLQ